MKGDSVHIRHILDFVRVWNIVTVNLPVLKQQVQAIQASLSTDA